VTGGERDAEDLHALGRLSGSMPVASHRPVAGGTILIVRRIASRAARWALAPLLARQESFNLEVASRLEALRSAAPAVEADSKGLELLSKRLEVVHESLHREIVGREAGVLRTLRDELELKTSQAVASVVASATADAVAGGQPTVAGLGDHLYREFVSRFRGSEAEIRERFTLYTELFAEAGPVLDLGCGRGEFLEALRERGVPASGVDRNAEMAEQCVARGLAVTRGDVLEQLASVPVGSLGGVFSAQVLEHLEPAGVQTFVALAARALRPGGLLVAETVNVESLAALTKNYFADWTHQTPIGPRSLAFLVERCGFPDPEIRYLSPIPDDAKLRIVPADPDLPTSTRDYLEAINRNFILLNALLFGPQDFALIARKPRS